MARGVPSAGEAESARGVLGRRRAIPEALWHGSLVGETVEDRPVRRAGQLRVREFTTAEHLDLTIVDTEADPQA